MRDTAAAGAIDRLYIENPDRLARDYPYQMVVVDELRRHGVQVIFLNRDLDESPEGRLLLQVQGIIAEYERTKIRERCRRGRLFAARSGRVSVLNKAPYGYRYVTKREGGGEARYVVQFAEAQIVKEMFSWCGIEGYSLNQICKRLKEKGIITRTGKTTWDRATVLGLLRNPAFMGEARFTSPTTVEVGGDRIEAGAFLIATGSAPWIPPIPGLEEAVSPLARRLTHGHAVLAVLRRRS